MKNIPIDKIRQYHFFMGHLGWIPRILFPADEIETITFLRDPLDRVLSEYAQIQRLIKTISSENHFSSIEDYLSHPNYIANRQTLYFCLDKGFEEESSQSRSDNINFDLMGLSQWLFPIQNDQIRLDMLQLATDRLHSCAFVGITEFYDESLEHLCEQYAWLPPRKVPKENASPQSKQVVPLSNKTRDRILELNQLDTKLYQEAIKMYEDQQRVRVFYDRETIEKKIYALLPVYKEIKYTFDDKIVGEGWGAREGESSNYFCWSTALQSTLIFSIEAKNDLEVSFHISQSLVPDYHKQLTLLANDHPISMSYKEHHQEGFIFKGIISQQEINYKPLKLTFSLPNLVCPMEVNPESDDTRKLGFICRYVDIRPIFP